MLFSKWQGTINLPAIPERRKRIDDNLVIQRLFMGAKCKAQIFDCEIPGHDLIRTELTDPYSEILLRRKGARRRPPERTVDAANGQERDDGRMRHPSGLSLSPA